ncbi:MAG: hypothetical protein ABW210_05675 [Achromobacter sp.]|jgi:hypothetical protein
MLICTVQRTHEAGKPKQRGILGPGLRGNVSMYAITHADMKRNVRVMQLLEPGEESTPDVRPLIPCLFDPEILTFSSTRGMMVVGFEELCGHRYYQGWLLHWDGR